MLEYFTRAPAVLRVEAPWLPKGEPWVWELLEEEEDTSQFTCTYLRDGQLYCQWLVDWRPKGKLRRFPTTSPAIALANYGPNHLLVLCADLSQYIYSDVMGEMLALRDPVTWSQVDDAYILHGYPSVPTAMNERTWYDYRM